MSKILHQRKGTIKRGFLVFIFLIFFISVNYANSNSSYKSVALIQQILTKSVTVNMKECTIKDILYEIQKQTNVSFIYGDFKELETKKVSFSVSKVALSVALDQLFKNTIFAYKVIDNGITIYKVAEESKKNRVSVKGNVVDEKNNPIIGATVIVIDTPIGAITDNKGAFSLNMKPGQTIEVSFVGFITHKFIVSQDENNLILKLKTDVLSVDDVVVNGYFARSRESLTGSAVVVTSKDLEKVSSQNIISALQVFDPSFRISDNVDMGSNPNVLPDFRIRGNSGLGGMLNEGSLKGSPNLPTFILDGYEVEVEKIYDLDLNRVESVTILKDASATAIYGSRAANGVVVVKTKSPEAGKLRVNYTFTGTLNTPDLSDYRLLNASDKLKAEVAADYYSKKSSADLEEALRIDYANRYRNVMEGVDTYWLSQPLRSAIGHKHSLYVDGGDDAVRYAVDLNYQAGPGIMKNSSRDRFGAGFQLSYNYKDKLMFRNYVTISKVKSKETNYGSFSEYAKMNPYYKIYDDNGNLEEVYHQEVVTTYRIYNPLFQSTLNNKNNSKYLEWTNNFDFEWNIISGLKVKARVAYSEKYQDELIYKSPKSLEYKSYDYTGGDKVLDKGYAKSFRQNTIKLDANVVLSYNLNAGKNNINLVAGGNIIEDTYNNEGYEVMGFANEILDVPAFARRYYTSSPSGDEGTTRLAGTFFNVNYSFDNKYLFDASFRLDGSSMYGYNKRSAPFWSVGLGWNIHNEKLLKDNKVVNLLKIYCCPIKLLKNKNRADFH